MWFEVIKIQPRLKVAPTIRIKTPKTNCVEELKQYLVKLENHRHRNHRKYEMAAVWTGLIPEVIACKALEMLKDLEWGGLAGVTEYTVLNSKGEQSNQGWRNNDDWGISADWGYVQKEKSGYGKPYARMELIIRRGQISLAGYLQFEIQYIPDLYQEDDEWEYIEFVDWR